MLKRKISILSCIILFSASSFIPALFAAKDVNKETGLLNKISLTKEENTLEVDIIFGPYTSHRHFELSEPNRIVLDLINIEDILSDRHLEVNDFGIQTIRAGMFKTNAARVVFDLKDKLSPYKITKTKKGLKITFRKKKTEEEKLKEEKSRKLQEIKAEAKKRAVAKAIAVKSSPKNENLKEIKEKIKEVKDTAAKVNEKLDKLQVKLDDTLTILKEMQDERARQEKRFVRIEITGNYFQPAEGEFKDTFGNGLMEGAELNIGVTNSLEFWLAMKNFSKSSLEGEAAPDRKIRLIPLEAGFKMRFNKGVVNPYIGGGVAYHQYKELFNSKEIKENKIGYIGQAGCFLKIAENLVLDAYAHYRYCLINVGGTELDISGFHVGAGLGFEF